MAPRPELQALLVSILGSDKVYFQPPPSLLMEYPCIVYKRDYKSTKHADNRPYSQEKRYQVTIMDRNPDSDIPDKVSLLPKCDFDRSFARDGLNHDVYNLFF